MSDFLTPPWFDRLEETLSRAVVGATTGRRLLLGQIINDTPDGTICFTIELGGGSPGCIIRGSVQQAQVTLVADYTHAVAISEGQQVADLLADGKIKVRGDVNALLRAGDELAALSTAFH